MGLGIGAIIGGAGGFLIGGPAGAAIGASMGGGFDANSANIAESRKNRRFQADMSNTAHQREVKDLRAAGLNPILSATGGQGASTPQGSKADIQDFVSKGISSGLEVKQLQQQIAQTDSNIQLQKAQGTASLASAARDANSAQQAAAQTRILNAQYPESQARGAIGGAIHKGVQGFQTGARKAAESWGTSSVQTKQFQNQNLINSKP